MKKNVGKDKSTNQSRLFISLSTVLYSYTRNRAAKTYQKLSFRLQPPDSSTVCFSYFSKVEETNSPIDSITDTNNISLEEMSRAKILILILTISTVITERAECKKRESESPQYTVVHSESDFEVRFYRESAWMTAPSDDISFEKATKKGFHRYPFSQFLFFLSSWCILFWLILKYLFHCLLYY